MRLKGMGIGDGETFRAAFWLAVRENCQKVADASAWWRAIAAPGRVAPADDDAAYLELAALPPSTFAPRSLLIVTYALCGVANLASIGLLVSTIGTLCPERRAEVAGLGVRSWIAGNMATAMTGAWIGLITWV